MTFELVTLVLFGLLLAAAAASDVLRRRIPNEVCIAILALGITTNTLLHGVDGVVDGFLGALIGFLVLVPFYAKRKMGAGDVKLLAACGAMLGTSGIVNGALLALFLGGFIGIVVLLVQRLAVYFPKLYTVIPQHQVSSGLKIELPYGVAIAGGALFAARVTVIDVSMLG